MSTDYDWQSEEDGALEIPVGRDPGSNPWGYFGRDDGTVGVGMFAWFPTLDELAAYIVNAEPQMYAAEIEDVDAFQAELRHALQPLMGGAPDLEAARSAINEVSSSIWRTDWIGTFEELRTSRSEFAADVRDSFHTWRTPGRDSSDPIADDDLDAFVEFVHNHGH